jgi:hypothetical protein
MTFSLPRFVCSSALLLTSMTAFAADSIPVQLDTTPPPAEAGLTPEQTPPVLLNAATDTTPAAGSAGATASPDKP